MSEKLVQLGLVGFGKEATQQTAGENVAEENVTRPEAIEETTVNEIDRELFVVPLKTTVFRVSQPDLGLVVVEPFFVRKRNDAKVRQGLVRVTISGEAGQAYRDGQRYFFNQGDVIEVPVNRLIKKK